MASWRNECFESIVNSQYLVSDLPDRRGLVFVIEETAKTNPKAIGQTPETLRLLEPSVLDEVKKSGFVEKVKN